LGFIVLSQVREFSGVAGVLALMAIVCALGAEITHILARDIRDLPEGRGPEQTLQPNVTSQSDTRQ
jgi:hypothetical protein